MIRKIANELIRRGVLRALGAYIAIVWLLAQGVVDVFPAIGLPDWAPRLFLFAAVAAVPLVAILSWKYDLTRKGFLRDRRDRLAGPVLGKLIPGDQTQRSDERTLADRGRIQVSWVDQDGQTQQRVFGSTFVVGRDYGADVRVPDGRVSRRHLKVYPEGGGWIVEDLTSLNGSFIDDVPIHIHHIDGETRVSLDKEGPEVTLTPQVAEPTRLTAGAS